ncbi:MAG: magnesium transporter, partial [Candidatus Hodarchaeota archaeon]
MMERYYDARVIINESLPFLALIIVFSMVTGNFLEGFAEDIIEKYSIILLILPAFINMSGSLASVFTSRITSSLYVGQIDKDFKPYRVLFLNMASMALVGFTGFLFLAFIGMTLASTFFDISVAFYNFVLIVVFSGIVTTIFMMF